MGKRRDTGWIWGLFVFFSTDGESYEDMEGCLYAQPRKRTQKLKDVTEDEGEELNMDLILSINFNVL